MPQTFKQINDGNNIEKPIKKVGLSLGLVFSKEEIKRFNLKYGSVIKLNDAEII
jgi:hypothetical protein